jgi:hypothetical protein
MSGIRQSAILGSGSKIERDQKNLGSGSKIERDQKMSDELAR